MRSKKFFRTILEAERIGLILYVVLIIVGAAIVALSSNNRFTALTASVSFISGVVVLSIIIYMETHIWNAE